MADTPLFTAGTSPVPGQAAVLYYATAGANQTAATLAAYFDMPNVDLDDGSRQGYGIGAREAAYDVAGVRAPNLSLAGRLADVGLVAKCFGTGAGTFGLDDVDLYFGAEHQGATGAGYPGWMDVIKKAKCNNFSLSGERANGAEIAFSAEFWGTSRSRSQTIAAPSLATVGAAGTPLTSLNVTTFNIFGVSYLDQWMSFNFSRNHNLERCAPVADSGDNNALSRTSGFIKPHQIVDLFEIGIYAPFLADALTIGAANATIWGDGTVPAVQIGLTNAGASILETAVKTLNLSATYARLQKQTVVGAPQSGEWDGRVTILPRGVTCTATNA